VPLLAELFVVSKMETALLAIKPWSSITGEKCLFGIDAG